MPLKFLENISMITGDLKFFHVLIGQLYIIFCKLAGPVLSVVWWGGRMEGFICFLLAGKIYFCKRIINLCLSFIANISSQFDVWLPYGHSSW